jgi:hypothetical protein
MGARPIRGTEASVSDVMGAGAIPGAEAPPSNPWTQGRCGALRPPLPMPWTQSPSGALRPPLPMTWMEGPLGARGPSPWVPAEPHPLEGRLPLQSRGWPLGPLQQSREGRALAWPPWGLVPRLPVGPVCQKTKLGCQFPQNPQACLMKSRRPGPLGFRCLLHESPGRPPLAWSLRRLRPARPAPGSQPHLRPP